MRKVLIEFVPGLLGACVGAILGFLIVKWIRSQGFYAPVIPGAFAGLACGFLSLDHSRIRGVLCALVALSACVLTEWRLFAPPVLTDGGLVQFIAHFYEQPPVTLIMVGLGTFLGFWWGRETTFPWRNRFESSEGKAPMNPDLE
jgi:hypothetical protein